MKDSGIWLLTSFVALIAGSIGYGLGDGLARYENITRALVGPDRLQWEVMLTGLTAIGGGYLAYRGAVKPYKDQRQSDAIAFKHRTEEAMAHFKFWTIDKSLWGIICAQSSDDDDIEKFEDMIIDMANTTLNDLPDIPNSLTTQELIAKRDRFVSALRIFGNRPIKYGVARDLSDDYNPDQAHEAMNAYVAEIDKPL